MRPATIQSSYRFSLRELAPDQPDILRQDNLTIVVMRRSRASITRLENSLIGLQDPASARSDQPEFARNALRSRDAEYFVAYALGTDLGCPLEVEAQGFREICGKARYDFAGRALIGDNSFPNLTIPDYTFADNFKTLTVKP